MNENEPKNKNKEECEFLKKWKEKLQKHDEKVEKDNNEPFVRELNEFLNSEEGEAALKILKIAEKRINLATSVKNGWFYKFYIDEDGLRVNVYHTTSASANVYRDATAKEMFNRLDGTPDEVKQLMRYSSFEDFVDTLKKEIDKIADSL